MANTLEKTAQGSSWKWFSIGALSGSLMFTMLAFSFQQVEQKAHALQFPPTSGEYLILPKEAIDGDTFSFYWLIEDRARSFGINAPEKNTQEGVKAKEFHQSILPKYPSRAIVYKKEKYGRFLIELFDKDNNSISEAMVNSDNAKHWDGKGERP